MKNPISKIFLTTICCIALTQLKSTATTKKPLQEIRGKVVRRVADGDTITVLDAAKTSYRIRLDKIDAPEQGQAYGSKSKQYLSSLVFGEQVIVKYEKKDQYGRVLGTIFLGNTDINLEMVRAGLAWHYKYFDDTVEYAEAEVLARKTRKGLWADKYPMNPYDFRRAKRKRK